MSLIIWCFGGQESRSAILGALKVLTEIIATSTRAGGGTVDGGWWYGGHHFGAIGAYTCTSAGLLIVRQFVSAVHLCTSSDHQTSIICYYGELWTGKNDRVKNNHQ